MLVSPRPPSFRNLCRMRLLSDLCCLSMKKRRDNYRQGCYKTEEERAPPKQVPFLVRTKGSTSAASALAPLATEIQSFARELDAVVAELPSRAVVTEVESEGCMRGRVDVAATLRRNPGRAVTRVVSNIPERRFDLPENLLLAATAERLVSQLNLLHRRGVAGEAKNGWAVGLRPCSERIHHTLGASVLREIPRIPIEEVHEDGARGARHAAFRLAMRLHVAMKTIDSADPAVVARVVAAGALTPLEPETRFEIAVLIRLARSLEGPLQTRGFGMSRALVESRRGHVFEFARNGDCARIYFNQLIFRARGPRDRGVQPYFGGEGGLRPDITIEFLRNQEPVGAMIVEAKLSNNADYLKSGYEQSLLYRNEFATALTGWPKVALVVSDEHAIVGLPRHADDVVAVGWHNWVPDIILQSMLAHLP